MKRPYELPDVIGDRWTDEYKLTVVGSASCREAAEAMVCGLEWVEIYPDPDLHDESLLAYYGTLAWLDGYFCMGRRDENTLIAWFASRLCLVSMCMTDGHEDESGMRYFNDCWADDEAPPHGWETWWTIDADPDEFWKFAQEVATR